jgi:tetratricopeptide (TPR) repeat protein
MNDLLQRGIELARAGQREQARTTLLQLVEADETNEMGWLWLSGVMDAAEDIRVCLENVLEINPENQQARQGIEWLNSRYTIPTAPEPEPKPEPIAHASVPSAPAPVAAPVAAVSDTPAVEPETPCPYCGSPTALGQRNCLSCKNSLMIRSDPPAKRSVWLSLLAGLRLLDAALMALSGCAVLAVAISAYQARQALALQAGVTSSNFAITIATIGVVILIWAGLSLSIGRGLLRRLRWAYYATIVLAVVSLITALIQFVAGQAVLATLNSTAAQSGGPPITPELVSSVASGWLVFGLVLQGLYIALIVASFRDFYGPLLRFAPEVKRIDHATNYNNGIAYKNRGMWYMAMREWELAVSRAPQNTTYLHALGLAYAQVGRFSRARATLDHAIDLAPGNAQMAESRTLIEKMATAQKG